MTIAFGTTLRNSAAVSAVLLALGVCWSRNTVSGLQRIPQTGRLESSKNKTGFAFEVLERSNPRDRHPTSTLMGWVYPHAVGNYKGRSGSPPLHVHFDEDEVFEIVDGLLGYVNDGKEGLLRKGEKVTLEAGKTHTFWNAEPNTTLVQKFKTVNRSGRHTPNERFFEQLASICYEYDGIEKVNPLQLAVLFDYGRVEVESPYPIKLFVRHIMVPLAKLLGYKAFYPEYIFP